MHIIVRAISIAIVLQSQVARRDRSENKAGLSAGLYIFCILWLPMNRVNQFIIIMFPCGFCAGIRVPSNILWLSPSQLVREDACFSEAR